MKRVLIVRLDAIGDYVLWRNCLRFMRNRGQYSGAHLTVFGNPAWRDLAETFDADCADEWIWADNKNDLFNKNSIFSKFFLRSKYNKNYNENRFLLPFC